MLPLKFFIEINYLCSTKPIGDENCILWYTTTTNFNVHYSFYLCRNKIVKSMYAFVEVHVQSYGCKKFVHKQFFLCRWSFVVAYPNQFGSLICNGFRYLCIYQGMCVVFHFGKIKLFVEEKQMECFHKTSQRIKIKFVILYLTLSRNRWKTMNHVLSIIVHFCCLYYLHYCKYLRCLLLS